MSDLAVFTDGVDSEGVYAFVEEIHMCLKTRPYEYVADLRAGTANGDFFIGETSLSSERLVDVLKEDIKQNTEGSAKYAYSIDVQFMKGSIRDIVYITILIKDTNGEVITTNYQFN
jgi:hypothetical protein